MIFNEAKRMENQEQLLASAVITLKCNFAEIEDYIITIIPMKNKKILKYKTACFECDSYITYEVIIKYIISEIKKEIYNIVYFKQDWADYDPMLDEDFENFLINISVNETLIFSENFVHDDKGVVFESLIKHMKPYFYISTAKYIC